MFRIGVVGARIKGHLGVFGTDHQVIFRVRRVVVRFNFDMTFISRCAIGHGVVKVDCTQVAIRWVNGDGAIRVQCDSADFVAIEVFDYHRGTNGHWTTIDFGNA